MKLRVLRTLARGVVLESVRRRDLWVVAILGLVIMMSAGTLGFFGFRGLEVFAKDLATSVVGLFGTILTVLVSSRVVPEELKNKTLCPLLARPITRLEFLAGKTLGCILVSWLCFGILLTVAATALVLFGVTFEPVVIQYVLIKMIGLALLATVTVSLSTLMTPSAASTLSLLLAFGSGAMVRGLVLAASNTPSLVPITKSLNWMIPQYSLFDLGGRVAYTGWGPIPLWVCVTLSLYAVGYGFMMLGLGYLKFRRTPL